MVKYSEEQYEKCLKIMSYPSEDWPKKFEFLRSKGMPEEAILESLNTVVKRQYSRYLYTGNKTRWCREKTFSHI